MPTLQKLFCLDITPEKFIDNCSEVELQEVILLANARLGRAEKAQPAPPEPAAIEAPPEPSRRKALPKAAPVPAVTRKEKPHWTPEEDAILRELWSSLLGVEIAQKLHRDYKCTMAHAKKLGLSKRNKETNTRNPSHQEESEPSKRKQKGRTTDCIGMETGTIRHSKKY
jgi:hypothetical protein